MNRPRIWYETRTHKNRLCIPKLFDFTSREELINLWSNINITHGGINNFSFCNIEFPWPLVHFDCNYWWIIIFTKRVRAQSLGKIFVQIPQTFAFVNVRLATWGDMLEENIFKLFSLMNKPIFTMMFCSFQSLDSSNSWLLHKARYKKRKIFHFQFEKSSQHI